MADGQAALSFFVRGTGAAGPANLLALAALAAYLAFLGAVVTAG